MKFAFNANGGHRVFFFFYWGTTTVREQYVIILKGWQKSHHLVIGCTERNEDAGKLLQLYTGVHGEHLGLQLLGNC